MSRDSNTHTVSIAAAGVSALSTLAASMTAGQWASFTMGGMSNALLSAGVGTDGQTHTINEFCARGHWDPVHKKIQYWGQGHQSLNMLVTWDDATNQWSRTTDVPYVSSGTAIGHAYYHLALDPATGDLYLRRYGDITIYKKPYNQNWTTVTSIINNANQVAGGLEWHTGLNSGAGGLAFCDTITLETSNTAVSSWTIRNGSLTGLGQIHNWIAATPNTGFVYFGGGNGSTGVYKVNGAGVVTTAPSTPAISGIWAESSQNDGKSQILSHPDGNQLLAFGSGNTTGTIHLFDGSSWTNIGTHQIGGDQWWGVSCSTYGVLIFVAQDTAFSTPIVKVYKPPSTFTYETFFPATENPISESGFWRNLGNLWTKIRTTPGKAFGTQTGSGFDDSYAYGTGFGANYEVEGTVYVDPATSGNTHEIELLLRVTDSANSVTLYEVDFSWQGNFWGIMVWQGPLGQVISSGISTTNLGRNFVTGDVIRARIVGQLITVWVNNVVLATGTPNTTFATGNPGFGTFWRNDGSSNIAHVGFSRVKVTKL